MSVEIAMWKMLHFEIIVITENIELLNVEVKKNSTAPNTNSILIKYTFNYKKATKKCLIRKESKTLNRKCEVKK